MKTIRTLMTGLAVAAVLLLPSATVTAKDSAALDLAHQLNQAFVEVADKVSPAVVVIQVSGRRPVVAPGNEEEEIPFFEFMPPELRKRFEQRRRNEGEGDGGGSKRPAPRSMGQGSGVVISEDGYIVTNNHVVEGADTIKVRFNDRDVFDAVIQGTDPKSDLAVIKIKNLKGRKLTVAKLADSSAAKVGEFSIAIGAPFNLDYSVTVGHISAKGRSFSAGTLDDQDFIQTDASINPGNSGGPLVNLYGEVVGINSMIRGENTGIGFAIPSNLVKRISDRLISDGKYVRSYLGVKIGALRDDPDYREINPGLKEGVVIGAILPNTPAAKSELKPADIVTAVDGITVRSSRDLQEEVFTKKPGQMVTLDVVRNGKQVKVKVKTEAQPDEDTLVANRRGAAQPEATSFGMTVKALTKNLAAEYDVELKSGVLVTGVERDSVAGRRGLQMGDIITEVNRNPVSSPREFQDALKAGDVKKGIIVNFSRGGSSQFMVLKDSGN
ncbi:MAG: trypsin-like peptidase domain-containing protein [Opitutaceae bacterium]|nr:trypsin-like peptidase domain-containing protein [Verrucomicrobiales bacterium]